MNRDAPRLQNTLDRSTLAAAALDQTLDPRSVVDDYFLKAGLSDFLTSVTVTQGLNFREVKATALADTEPLFLHMMGIDKFEAPGQSTAEQRVNNVEVMLVLDVSGSMNSNSKLTNLKTAAKQFVATVLGNDAEHKISIGTGAVQRPGEPWRDAGVAVQRALSLGCDGRELH